MIVLSVLALALGMWGVLQSPELLLNPGTFSRGHAKTAGECFACHTPFGGPMDEKCVACHQPAKIGAGKPGRALFHQNLADQACVGCHTDHQGATPPKPAREFDHTLLQTEKRTACSACHQTPTDGLHRGMQGECSACHADRAWRPATFNHDRLFRFDRHHPSTCADCHPGGVFERYTCYGCHEHNAAKIGREHLEEGIRDYERCVLCHRSGDEHEAERLWKSGAWKGAQGLPGVRPAAPGVERERNPAWERRRALMARDHDDDDDDHERDGRRRHDD